MANDLAGLTQRLATALRDPTFTTWEPEELEDLLVWSLASLAPVVVRTLDPEKNTITLVSGTYYYALPPEVLRIYRVDHYNGTSEYGILTGGIWEIVGDADSYGAKLHVSPTTVVRGGTLRLNGYGRYRLGTVAAATTLAATAAAAATNLRLTAVTNLAVDDLLDVGTTPERVRVTSVGTSGAGGTGVTITPALVTAKASGQVVAEVSQLPPDKAIPLILALARAEALRRMVGDRARFVQWAGSAQANVTVNELVLMLNDADREVERLRRTYPAWEKPVPGRI
jgi:hypothetical protein